MSGRVKEAKVTAGGKGRTIRCDFNAMCTAEEATGRSYLGSQTNRFSDIRALLFGCFVSGARKHGEPVDFTLEDVGDWMPETEGRNESLTAIFLDLWSDFRGQEAAEDGSEEGATHDDPQTVEEATA